MATPKTAITGVIALLLLIYAYLNLFSTGELPGKPLEHHDEPELDPNPIPIPSALVLEPELDPNPIPSALELEPEFLPGLEHYRQGPVCSFPALTSPTQLPSVGHVCIIVRSYWGHISNTRYPFSTLLNCLEGMEYDDWSLYVFAVDNIPAPDLELVLNARRKHFRKRYHFVDTPFHYPWECSNDCGYSATDYAIYHSCPSTSRWLLVTQGDNEYAPTLFSHLDPSYDAIGFDWFSRWTSHISVITYKPEVKKPCDEIIPQTCMGNKWLLDRTDLGTVVWNYNRFILEERKYSRYNPTAVHDGMLATECVASGWKVKNVSECLYSHNPNQWAECRRQ